MKCILWGTDEEIDIAENLLSRIKKRVDITAIGVDKENYAYHKPNGRDQMTASDILRHKTETNADMILLASSIRYLETEYKQLTDLGATGISAIPSYLYRKEILDAADEAAIFTPYEKLPPQLYYLEFHAADHCNLNCRGCTHFSNIVPGKVFPDLDELEKSVRRLRELLHNIEIIRILGGEPFLNPQLHKILLLIRNYFPYSKIILVTNGLMTHKLPHRIIQSILQNNVQVTVSVYPPLRQKIIKIEKFFHENGITVQFGERQNDYHVCEMFTKFIDKNGKQDGVYSWTNCPRKRCSFLYHSKLYACALPALIPYYNQYFHANIPSNDGIDISEKTLNGYSLLMKLQKPMSMCSYCGEEQSYPWSTTIGKAKESDWCIE